ncbi:MAG: type II toxin-antitoxin system VapC family toxin [Kineosporiaceae bacterium]
MIVLDASVLIAHLELSDQHHERATQLLLDHVEAPFAASVVTVAEVLTGADRAGRAGVGSRALARLGVERVPVSGHDPERLAELRRLTRLTLPDCCVLLAAEATDALVATFDDQLAARAADLGCALGRH